VFKEVHILAALTHPPFRIMRTVSFLRCLIKPFLVGVAEDSALGLAGEATAGDCVP